MSNGGLNFCSLTPKIVLVVEVVVFVLVVIVLAVDVLDVLVILVTLDVGMSDDKTEMALEPAVVKLAFDETCCPVCVAHIDMGRPFVEETNVGACVLLAVDTTLINEANVVATKEGCRTLPPIEVAAA